MTSKYCMKLQVQHIASKANRYTSDLEKLGNNYKKKSKIEDNYKNMNKNR